MKKLFLSLLLPFLLVMGMSAVDITQTDTSYIGDDVHFYVDSYNDGTFRVVIENLSEEDIDICYEDTFFCPVDEHGENTDKSVDVFSDNGTSSDNSVVAARNFWGSDYCSFIEGTDEMVLLTDLIIDGQHTAWRVKLQK